MFSFHSCLCQAGPLNELAHSSLLSSQHTHTQMLASDNSGLPSNFPSYFCLVYYLLIWLLFLITSHFGWGPQLNPYSELVYSPWAPHTPWPSTGSSRFCVPAVWGRESPSSTPFLVSVNNPPPSSTTKPIVFLEWMKDIQRLLLDTCHVRGEGS